MAVKIKEGSMNVVEAARRRIQNVFDTGLDVAMSISGGKDSIVMTDIVYKMIKEGKINPKQLTVQFIDEEAMFDDVINIVNKWRTKLLLEGVKFNWYCIQVKHFNCLNTLSDDETFILWDRTQKDKWIRPMPKFAIKNHPLLRERIDNYQMFLPRVNKGKLQLIGVRASESLMRSNNLGTIFQNNKDMLNPDNSVFPIYDFVDDDIWLYIKNNKLDFPQTYLDLWSIGEGRNKMRISQFFSIDTARVLVNLEEHQPNLMARIIKREPNAYLASIYWDTEMFRSIGKKSSKTAISDRDFKQEVMDQFEFQKDKLDTDLKRANYKKMRSFVIRNGVRLKQKHYKMILEILISGDPKSRSYRGLITSVFSDLSKHDEIERKRKKK